MNAALFLLFAIYIWETGANPCPHRCTCKLVGAQAEWLKLVCSDGLQEIKDVNIDAVSVELLQLDLSKNEIIAIGINAFKNLTNLRRLDISANKILTIEEGCFSGLENLERLDLSRNRISTIDVYAFRKLLNLKRLDLSGNKINTLAPSLFHDLMALDRLKLNGNNLETLKEGLFHGLKSLKQLDLSSNPWKCDCDLYWFSSWIQNSSIKLIPPPKCTAPQNVRGQPIRKLRLSENLQCQWKSPTIEIRPVQNQVVFAGDSITLKCRAPSVTEDRMAKLNWLWYPNATMEMIDTNAYRDPQTTLSNIKIENRYLSDSGIVDSSLSILPVQEEHNGQWNCLLASTSGNRSKAISVIVISEHTRYCPLAVTRNNKGVYTWPRTVVGWKAELPCEGNRLSGLMQVALRASYRCNITGHWEELNTESCPYMSHTTKVLEQFSKVNLSLTKGSLLETAKRFKNYTGGDGAKLTDPVEINFVTQTIENYLSFLVEEKELGPMLIDVISSMMSLSREMLRTAEVTYKSCSRLVKAVETITEFTPAIQLHKRNMALEEFRVKRDSFTGLTCTWYVNLATAVGIDSETRSLHCTTNNRSIPINTQDKIVEASIQLPPTLLQRLQDAVVSHQLTISMYSDSRFFPKMVMSQDDEMDVTTSVVGSKLIGSTIENLTEPVYVMLRTPMHHYTGRRPRPVIWDEGLGESGGWTTDGCRLSNLLNNLIIFHCDKLGYYGLLQEISHLAPNGNGMTRAKFRLSNPAIYIGSFITIICLVITSVTYVVCYTSIAMPKKAKHCVINTWSAMAMLSFLYTVGIQQTENVQICQGVGLALHYLSLCCLFWMAVSASNMYKKVSKRPDHNVLPDDELTTEQPIPKPLLGLYLVGWGIALIICGISGAINLREYAGYSHCFLTSGPALAALFVPAAILIVYLITFHLLIRYAIRSAEAGAQLSEGTQATENMDLELLEPSNSNPSADRNSVHSVCSAQTLSSDVEDNEHSQISRLKGQIVMLILYLISWLTAAGTTAKPLGSYVIFEETVFACLHALSTSSLGIFVLLFYGIARNDVRSQWLRMRCWLRKRKNRCCRTRSVSDAVPAMPTQPLVQNLLLPPLSNSQATQVTSDTNSVSSSRNTNRSQIRNATSAKIGSDLAGNQNTLPVSAKMGNVNLVVLHRQQYRSNNNSVATYTESVPACVEMFYNPHQSGVARKFFKKQRRHTKNNNLGPRKQGDGGATSDGGSCISVPRPAPKIDLPGNIERSILSTSSKVNNTNIHVEMNLTASNDGRNVNILSDSGGSVSEGRNAPMRFVIGQENLLPRNMKKVNNDHIAMDESSSLEINHSNANALAGSPQSRMPTRKIQTTTASSSSRSTSVTILSNTSATVTDAPMLLRDTTLAESSLIGIQIPTTATATANITATTSSHPLTSAPIPTTTITTTSTTTTTTTAAGTTTTTTDTTTTTTITSINVLGHESDGDTKTDMDEKHLKNVSQQCSLDYSSEVESIAQMTSSERSDQNLPEICEIAEALEEENERRASVHQSRNSEMARYKGCTGWLYHSNSMYCLPYDRIKPLRNNYRNSLNDVASLSSSRNCEYSRPSLTDFQSDVSSNAYDQVPESRRSFDQSDQSLSEINSLTSDNAFSLIRTGTCCANNSAVDLDRQCASSMSELDYCLPDNFVSSALQFVTPAASTSRTTRSTTAATAAASPATTTMNILHSLSKSNEYVHRNFNSLPVDDSSNAACTLNSLGQQVSSSSRLDEKTMQNNSICTSENPLDVSSDIYLDDSGSRFSLMKKETSV